MYSRVSLQRSCGHVLGSVMESTAAPTQSSCPSGTDRFFLRHSRHFVPGYSHESLRDNKVVSVTSPARRLHPRLPPTDFPKREFRLSSLGNSPGNVAREKSFPKFAKALAISPVRAGLSRDYRPQRNPVDRGSRRPDTAVPTA